MDVIRFDINEQNHEKRKNVIMALRQIVPDVLTVHLCWGVWVYIPEDDGDNIYWAKRTLQLMGYNV